MRGTTDAYLRLLASENKPDDDTLYFISDADSDDVTLYLGSKVIAGSDEELKISLKSLSDIALKANLLDKDILVYDSASQKWVNSSFEDAISVFIGATTQTTGKAGLVPAPGLGQTDLFLRSDGTWAAISGLSESNVTSIENDSGLDHMAIIEQASADWILTKGDIIIIKDIISNGLYEHTSYVYNGSVWAAMDGNYNADNVYFNDDILVTTRIGTIQNLVNGKATLLAKGKNVKQVLSSLLAKREVPVASLPSASISLTNGGTYEVGTTLTPQWKTTFSTGSYTYGPATGVTDNGGSVTSTKDTVATTITAGSLNGKTGSFNEYQVEDDTSYQATLKYGWNAGTNTPLDNFGDEYTNSANNLPIAAASNKTATSGSIAGYRKWFKGGLSTTEVEEPLTSSVIRDKLSGSTGAITSTTFEMQAASYKDCKRIIIAIPQSAGREVIHVALKSTSNIPITSEFKERDMVSVEGAEGYAAVPYRIWVYDPANIDSSEIYTITIG